APPSAARNSASRSRPLKEMLMRLSALILVLALPDDGDRVLEKAADAASWSNLEIAKEPKAQIERTPEGTLKITFAGGRWPTVAMSAVPEDWTPWKSFAADVTVSRS